MRLYFSLKTIEPIIVSQNTATTTNHQGLDYIPGSALLGVVAASLYRKLDEQDSWDIFHSGQVQFGPCYPVKNQQLCLPTPSSWHFDKLATPTVNNRYQLSEINNHASKDFKRSKEIQYKQCRNGYINASGEIGQVVRNITTKTAIDRSKGTAEERKLFSYSYIESDQIFIGWIQCETKQQLELVSNHLIGEKRIGRSKNSEFGRVVIEKHPTVLDIATTNYQNELILWCLSDCQCLNQYGLATLSPTLDELIDGATGKLDHNRSFIRYHYASRFNQTRGGLDSEQPLISKGSILVYKDASISDDQLLALANKGIGINRQQGLGWVYINPQWANSSTLPNTKLFSSHPIEIKANTKVHSKTSPSSPITHWIDRKITAHQQNQATREKATELARNIIAAYEDARAYNNIADQHIAGPSRTQWGRVRDVLRNNTEDWLFTLFMDSHAICKPQNDELGWGIKWHDGTRITQFSDFLLDNWQKHNPCTLIQTLERLSPYDLSTKVGLDKANTRFLTKESKTQQGVNV